jgi:hypothetical protein
VSRRASGPRGSRQLGEAHTASPVSKDIEIVVAPYDSSFLLLSPV